MSTLVYTQRLRRALPQHSSRRGTTSILRWPRAPSSFWSHLVFMPGGAPKAHEASCEGSRTSLIRQDRDVGCIHPLLWLSESHELLVAGSFNRIKARCARGGV